MDMDIVALPIEGIVSNPKVRGGKPIIDGTGLRVMDVAARVRFHHETPEEIAAGFQVTMAQVHAALAYYFAHQDAIDGDLDADTAFLKEAKEKGLGQRHSPVLR
jgi:uncharacterized protein (DUF433 family)